MRLARLAAVGLAIGVIAGFAIALLRPRPHDPSAWDDPGPSGDRTTDSPADEQMWEQFREAEQAPVADLRSHRRVTG
jgi:hypothetical protein